MGVPTVQGNSQELTRVVCHGRSVFSHVFTRGLVGAADLHESHHSHVHILRYMDIRTLLSGIINKGSDRDGHSLEITDLDWLL